MTDIKELLRRGDPVASEPSPSHEEFAVMRRVVTGVAIEKDQSSWWARPVLVGAALACTLVVGVMVGRRLPPPHVTQSIAPATDVASPAQPGLSQMEFTTAGGTRVIWFFNPDLSL